MKISNEDAFKLFESASGKTLQEKFVSATSIFICKYEIAESNFDSLRLRFKIMYDNKPKNNRDGVKENGIFHFL